MMQTQSSQNQNYDVYAGAIRLRRAIRRRRKCADILAKTIRVLTTAPILSLVLFTLLFFTGGVFTTPTEFAVTIVLFTLLPLTAYPLQKILPAFRSRGRDGQRTLAMIMANVGYLLSMVYAMSAGVGSSLLTLYLTYLFSGAALLIINKAFGFHASGHACGLCGPAAAMVYFTGWPSLIVGAVLFGLCLWGSLHMGRHTIPQFFAGSAISIVIFLSLAAVLL
ncbi:MAG: hypothetical protein HFE66_01935 [Clostridiales bacterium]|jgi:hypothetical protein|nr:hypothetical protein [Clostridiales bacterium]